jgi:hypothetical protein
MGNNYFIGNEAGNARSGIVLQFDLYPRQLGGIISKYCGGRTMADNDRHPGISMHKLAVDGGFAGLLFTVGSAVIFILGLPSLWYFVAFSAALGVGIAAIFRMVNGRRADRMQPLSILTSYCTGTSAVLPRQNVSRIKNLDRLPATYPA